MALRRAARHWQKASEAEKGAIASLLGFTETSGERWPVPSGVAADYKAALAWCADAIGDPDY